MNKAQTRHYLSSSFIRRPLMWWRHRSITSNDVMLASYPRSGNSWARFLLYELVTGKTADFNAINDPYSPCADFPDFQKAPIISAFQGRLIKTHELYRKDYKRAIYIVRDPREVIISEYYYMVGRGLIKGTLNEFTDKFVTGKIHGYDTWNHHVMSWINAPISDLLIVRYEDLKVEGRKTLAGIASFLNIDTTIECLDLILEHNTFQAMRKSEETLTHEAFRFVNSNARFVRQGQTNSWQDVLTPAQVEKISMIMAPVMNQLGYL